MRKKHKPCMTQLHCARATTHILLLCKFCYNRSDIYVHNPSVLLKNHQTLAKPLPEDPSNNVRGSSRIVVAKLHQQHRKLSAVARQATKGA